MSWRRVGVIYAVLLVLAGVTVVDEAVHRGEVSPAEEVRVTRSLLGVPPELVGGIVLRRGALRVHAMLDGARWRVLEPVGADIPPDLIAAIVATLTGNQVARRLGSVAAADLESFGLDNPHSHIEVTMRGGVAAPVHVVLGGSNPPKTAIYAKRTDLPMVFLAGGNLRYYLDLIFEAIAAAPADGVTSGPGDTGRPNASG